MCHVCAGTTSLWPSPAATAWAETQPPPDTIPGEVWSNLGAATTPSASHSNPPPGSSTTLGTTPSSTPGTAPLFPQQQPGLPQWQPPLWQLQATWRFAGSLLGAAAQQEEAWEAAGSPPLSPRAAPRQQRPGR